MIEVRKLDPQPGDLVIIRYPADISQEKLAQLNAAIQVLQAGAVENGWAFVMMPDTFRADLAKPADTKGVNSTNPYYAENDDHDLPWDYDPDFWKNR